MPTDRNQPHTTRLGVEYIKGHAYTGTEKGEHDMTDGDCLALYTAPEVLARFKRDGWPEWVELDGFHQRLMWSVCEWWVQRVSEDRVCWLDYRPDAHTALCILREHAASTAMKEGAFVRPILWRRDTQWCVCREGPTGAELWLSEQHGTEYPFWWSARPTPGGCLLMYPTKDAALWAALAAAEGEK